MLKTHTRLLKKKKNTVKYFGGGCKRQRPFAYKKALYLMGLKYTTSFFLVKIKDSHKIY